MAEQHNQGSTQAQTKIVANQPLVMWQSRGRVQGSEEHGQERDEACSASVWAGAGQRLTQPKRLFAYINSRRGARIGIDSMTGKDGVSTVDKKEIANILNAHF